MENKLIWCPGCGLPLGFDIDENSKEVKELRDLTKSPDILVMGNCSTCKTQINLYEKSKHFLSLNTEIIKDCPEDLEENIRCKRRQCDCSITQTLELKEKIKELEAKLQTYEKSK